MTDTTNHDDSRGGGRIMGSRARLVVGVCVAVLGVVSTTTGTAGAVRHDRRETTRVTLTVVNQHGEPLHSAAVMACPIEHGSVNCEERVVGETNRRGLARVRLHTDVEYDVTAFARNPEPRWACPGFILEGGEFYFAGNPFIADPNDMAKRTQLVIDEPAPSDCAPVTVTDQLGNPLPAAGLIICPFVTHGTPCENPTFGGADLDGVIRLDVDPETTYTLTAFIKDADWPCPDYIDPAGAAFHFSAELEIVGAVLSDGGATMIIDHPAEQDCAPSTRPTSTTMSERRPVR